jgi:hypothetical protein
MTILKNDCLLGSATSPAGQTNDNEDMNEHMNVNVNVNTYEYDTMKRNKRLYNEISQSRLGNVI